MKLSDAIEAEQAERFEEAARLYEALIRQEHPPLEGFVNLLVLYWQVTEYGFWVDSDLELGFVKYAAERLSEMLKSEAGQLSDNPQVDFWVKYIRWADYGGALEVGECRKLLREHPEYLEPAMFVFSTTQGADCEKEAVELLKACREINTCRTRYVASVIESTIARKAHG